MFRQWPCGKAAGGLERIICVVLVKINPRKHGYNWNTVESGVNHYKINQSFSKFKKTFESYTTPERFIQSEFVLLSKYVKIKGKRPVENGLLIRTKMFDFKDILGLY